jgi:type II secretory pathway pseudopilin PulG
MVELLVIMAIIGILTAITLQAVSGLMAAASRSRAKAEIKGMELSLENYKTDNGAYPICASMATTDYTKYDGSGTSTNYIYGAQILYQSITGKTNYLDPPLPGTKSYGSFKVGQLGNASSVAGNSGPNVTYVQDPWTYAYGYSTGTTSGSTNFPPINGTGFFDLWSTGGNIVTSPNNVFTNTAAWMANWPNQ